MEPANRRADGVLVVATGQVRCRYVERALGGVCKRTRQVTCCCKSHTAKRGRTEIDAAKDHRLLVVALFRRTV